MTTQADLALDGVMAVMTGAGQQFELSDQVVGKATYKAFKNAPPSLGHLFAFSLQHADLDFIVYEGERYTFGQTFSRAQALAAHLQQEYDLQKGARVILAMRNYPEFMFAYMALAMVGAVIVPVNAWWQTEELGYAIEDSGAALAICDGPRAQRIAQLPDETRPALLVVRAEEAPAVANATLLSPQIYQTGAQPQPVDIAPDDDLSILYTSGSTGFPKGAVSTHRGVVTSLMNFACYGLAVQQVEAGASAKAPAVQAAVLLTVPLFHVTGLIPVCLINFLIGRKLVMMHKWDAGDALAVMERENVTYFVGVPTMSLELMQHPDRATYNLEHLEDIGAGGAARPADHVGRLKEAFPQARPGIGYGLTETNAAGCINSRTGYLDKPGSTGRVTTPAVDVAIFNDGGQQLDVEEIGEVWIKSGANVRGYWNRPEDTAEAFTSDGWFKSGDLGRLDADGYLFIVDRKKDIIIRGGENVSCLEVEAALFKHPSVAEACVFGLPDERLGEVVSAVVTLLPDADITVNDLTDYARDHLASFKVPTHIWVMEEALPKLATGKFDKRGLKAKITERLLQQ